jgi:hypothetical protein
MSNIIQVQQEVCKQYGTRWVASPDHLKVGIARNVREALQPLNGLRHPRKETRLVGISGPAKSFLRPPTSSSPTTSCILLICAPPPSSSSAFPQGGGFLPPATTWMHGRT